MEGFRRPSPRMWVARQVSLALTAVPLALAAAVPAWIFGGATAGIPVTAAAAVLVAFAWALLRGRYNSWGYVDVPTTSSSVTGCSSAR